MNKTALQEELAELEKDLVSIHKEVDSWKRSSIQDGSDGACWHHRKGSEKTARVKEIKELLCIS